MYVEFYLLPSEWENYLRSEKYYLRSTLLYMPQRVFATSGVTEILRKFSTIPYVILLCLAITTRGVVMYIYLLLQCIIIVFMFMP
jgi:hypothetical protein